MTTTTDPLNPDPGWIHHGIAALEAHANSQAAKSTPPSVPPPGGDHTGDNVRDHENDDTLRDPDQALDDTEAGGEVEAGIQDNEDAESELDEGQDAFVIDLADGDTRRVQSLRRRVAEQMHLAGLQAQLRQLRHAVFSKRAMRDHQRFIEAAQRHALRNNEIALAWRDQRMRLITTWMVVIAAGIALAASSIGVQRSVAAALKLEHSSIGWWASYFVEPALSLSLYATVLVQAYSAIRGKVVDRRSREGRKLLIVEGVLLGLTLTLNCWPAFLADHPDYWTLALAVVVHALGPIAAVVAVWILPTLWSILSTLPVQATGVYSTDCTPDVLAQVSAAVQGSVQPVEYTVVSTGSPSASAGRSRGTTRRRPVSAGKAPAALPERSLEDLVAEAERKIASGELRTLGIHAIRKAIGRISTARATEVQAELKRRGITIPQGHGE